MNTGSGTTSPSQPEDGGAISSADYAIGLVDLIEQDNHHRAHVNLAH